jgi:indolepyruvate ferredoxin oxidoreductase alpha subunit
MGASMGVAHGIALANIDRKNVAVIGDSTFFHAGLPALANVIYNQGNFLTIIVDNHTTAMTGHQGNPGSGWTLQGTQSPKIDFAQLAQAMGVEVVEKADPTDLKSFEVAVRRCLESESPAVLIAEAPCVFADYEKHAVYTVDEDICNGCSLCFRLGCPAIGPSETIDEKTERPKAAIDPLLCIGCDLCAQVCARGGIVTISSTVKA